MLIISIEIHSHNQSNYASFDPNIIAGSYDIYSLWNLIENSEDFKSNILQISSQYHIVKGLD